MALQIDSAAALREEFSACEGRLNFIKEALSVGMMELDKVHGKYSREICETIRPQRIAQIRQILEHVKAICEANDALEQTRVDLEREGIRTGSLPHCTFDIGGRWNDQYGGRVVGYQRYISESYPELTSPAGQEIRKKRAELAAKVQSFEKEGATS